jgi:hypothetical protein
MMLQAILVEARQAKEKMMKNATFKPAAAGPLEIRFYAIDPTKRQEFLIFYRDTLVPWLTSHGDDTANLSLIETDPRTSLQLIFAAAAGSPPWDTKLDRLFADLDKLLLETDPVVV